MMKFFVIEHPSRGWYTGSEYELLKTCDYGWIPHFAWSITARDDRVERMYSQSEVNRELKKIPKRLRDQCRVKEFEV